MAKTICKREKASLSWYLKLPAWGIITSGYCTRRFRSLCLKKSQIFEGGEFGGKISEIYGKERKETAFWYLEHGCSMPFEIGVHLNFSPSTESFSVITHGTHNVLDKKIVLTSTSFRLKSVSSRSLSRSRTVFMLLLTSTAVELNVRQSCSPTSTNRFICSTLGR